MFLFTVYFDFCSCSFTSLSPWIRTLLGGLEFRVCSLCWSDGQLAKRCLVVRQKKHSWAALGTGLRREECLGETFCRGPGEWMYFSTVLWSPLPQLSSSYPLSTPGGDSTSCTSDQCTQQSSPDHLLTYVSIWPWVFLVNHCACLTYLGVSLCSSNFSDHLLTCNTHIYLDAGVLCEIWAAMHRLF